LQNLAELNHDASVKSKESVKLVDVTGPLPHNAAVYVILCENSAEQEVRSKKAPGPKSDIANILERMGVYDKTRTKNNQNQRNKGQVS